MSFSYNSSLTSDLDKVRFYLGDTISTSALFSDEEIAAMLAVATTPLATGAVLADALAARFGRMVSQSIDGASFSYGERAKFYLELANRLRAQAALGTADTAALGAVFISGISKGDMASVEDDTDRIPSSFKVGMHDDLG